MSPSPKPPDHEPKIERCRNVSGDAETTKMMKSELSKWEWKVKISAKVKKWEWKIEGHF